MKQSLRQSCTDNARKDLLRQWDTEANLSTAPCLRRAAALLGEAFGKALIEKTEEEFDAAAADKAYAQYLTDGRKSRPLSELKKELGL